MKEGEEPIAAAVPPESIDLGKIQWQVVRQDTVLDLGLGPWRSLHGSSTVPARRDAGARRIMVDLRRLDPEHVQHHLGILWIVLVPAVVQRFSCSGQRQRRHQPHLETRFSQAPCYRPVIVPGRFKGADHRAAVRLQHFDHMVVLNTGC